MGRIAEKDLRHRVARSVCCAGVATMATPMAAVAAVDIVPHASARYEHQSNPLYQWGGSATPPEASSDEVLALTAGLEGRVPVSRQTFIASAEIRRFDYADLTYLSRTEELFSGNLDWVATSNLDGSVGYRHEHRMVPLDELGTDRVQLMETEGVASASANLTMPAQWRLESGFRVRNLDSPRPGRPDLSLRETVVHEGVRRALGKFSLGLDAEYLSGSYHATAQLGSRSYHQTTVQLAGEREIPDLSAFECAVGYTRRTDAFGGGVSALTGALRYERAISGKTSAEVVLRRAVNSYVTGAGSEIDTMFALQAAWRPTSRIGTRAAFAWTRTDYPRESAGSGGSRHDRYQFLRIDVRYQVDERLSIGPYARRAVRSSNVPAFGFDTNSFGIELSFREAT